MEPSSFYRSPRRRCRPQRRQLPLTTGEGKPLKTMATKATQQAAAAKQKQLKSGHPQVKPIQAKLQPHPQQQQQ
ncbi:hypothetical protein KR054_006708 [Drosophila jambulina]|nr:hypothetical protein KR054_006708 [Drosophila jambulina]